MLKGENMKKIKTNKDKMSDFIAIFVIGCLIVALVVVYAFILPTNSNNSNTPNYILIKVAYAGNPNITVIQNCTQFFSTPIGFNLYGGLIYTNQTNCVLPQENYKIALCTIDNSSILCNYSQNRLAASWSGKIIYIEKYVNGSWVKE